MLLVEPVGLSVGRSPMKLMKSVDVKQLTVPDLSDDELGMFS